MVMCTLRYVSILCVCVCVCVISELFLIFILIDDMLLYNDVQPFQEMITV